MSRLSICLAAGRLVRPFAGSSPVAFAYYIVCPRSAMERPKVAAFCKWLQTEAKRHREESGQGEAETAARQAAS